MPGLAIVLKDDATPAVLAIQAGIAPSRLRPIVGRAGVNVVRKHLFKLDRARANALGGKRTHFYAAAARSTHFRNTDAGVVVSISHIGIAQRYFGGTIRPVNAKRLAIPARREAHGRRPREFNSLRAIYFRSTGSVALVEAEQTQIGYTRKGKIRRGTRKGGGVMYWLVKEVTQKGDKKVLPPDRQLANGIAASLDSYINTLAKGGRK